MFVLARDVAVQIGIVSAAKRDCQIVVLGEDSSARVYEERGDGLELILRWESEKVRFYAGLSGAVLRPVERCLWASGEGRGCEDIGWWLQEQV